MSAGASICSHLDQIEVTALPDKIEGCEECLKIGSGWPKVCCASDALIWIIPPNPGGRSNLRSG